MKLRTGFISNSSSTSFIIKNFSDEVKTLVDFVKENPQLLEEYNETYDWNQEKYTQAQLEVSAGHDYPTTFKSGESKECAFGDEHGTPLGDVFDYVLRDGGQSKNFTWKFKEYHR